METAHAKVICHLLSKELVSCNDFGEYKLTDEGNASVSLMLDRFTPEQMMMIGLYYADKLGIHMHD
ncbi:hypothetical protein [Paenibacillus tyrfis]|uniref:Uncharacterized protein n=1 Tax=Paenibacillus tyrfis TaxID=1501230 RepID=A0A081NY87_9BACL|nr:hypothetical protein [Paenibacillus tyrfis]KEQ23410.1 hypothetical protein ET33_16390 [Paenibacillus tyrfis]